MKTLEIIRDLYYYIKCTLKVLEEHNMSRNEFQYKKMLFVGGGNIAGAVACGLVNGKSVPAEFITVYDINETQLVKFKQIGIKTTTSLESGLQNAEVVFLAVKPNIVASVMKSISEIGGYADNAFFVSFAASVTIDHIVKSFGLDIPVIRTMPSTPILVGEGVLAVSKNELVSQKNFEYFCHTSGFIRKFNCKYLCCCYCISYNNTC